MKTSLQIAKESYNRTIQKANRLFVSEGAKHDLHVQPMGYQSKWRLMSTSGTNYRIGSKEDCLNRMDELMLFALLGYENLEKV
jgi:hypothetical protein